MSAFALEKAPDLCSGFASDGLATRLIEEKQQQQLSVDIEELSSLRFSIVITARWEASPDEDPRHKKELRAELEDLRSRYFDKLDQIAMAFGVTIAIQIKDEVERRVTLPLNVNLAEAVIQQDTEDDAQFHI